MGLLLKYVLATGTIVGIWESHSVAVLQAQRVAEDPVHGYLLSLLALPASTVEQGYLVRDGAVVMRSLDRKD